MCSVPCAVVFAAPVAVDAEDSVVEVDVGAVAVTDDAAAAAAVAFGLWVVVGAVCVCVCELPSLSASASASRGDGEGEDVCLSLPELWHGDDCDVLDAVRIELFRASVLALSVKSFLCTTSGGVGLAGDDGCEAGGVRLWDGRGFLACAAATSFLDASTASVALLCDSS